MFAFIRYARYALLTLLAGYSLAAHAFIGDTLFLPPSADYRTYTTEHFIVTFPGKYHDEGLRAAGFLEDAHRVLSKAFDYSPGHKCRIILTDNEDFANGVTSAIGHQGIVLYLTAPDPYTSIGEYDHWLRSLIVHEYSHYVTLEQTRGIFELFRYLMGDLVFPNHLWPTWISEGMAVYAESVYTHQGRGHGTYYTTLTRDGIARGRLGTPKFLSFDQLMGPVPDFPFGESQYYAGYAMIDELIARHGDNAPARFAEESSWRIPFFNNGTLENISRDHDFDTFQQLWASWIKRETRELGPEIDWVRAHGAPDPRFLTDEGTSATGTRLSPDGKRLAYTFSSGHERPALYVEELATGKKNRLEDAIAGPGLAWSPDGRHLYYAKADFNGPYAFYSDLYERLPDGGGARELTWGERAKDPDYCATPGGARIVYSSQRGAVSSLKSYELATGSLRVLYTAPSDHHISNPRCAPDGSKVYFAEHGTRPLEEMRVLALSGDGAKNAPETLFGGEKEGFGALFPEPLAGGDLYFTRVKDGFYELARYDAGRQKISLVARSTGGYWLPSVARADAELMSVSYLSSTGLRAALVNPRALEAAASEAPARAPEAPVEIKHAPDIVEAPTAERSPERGYNLLRSLEPRIWAPYISLSDSSSQYGFTLLGWDDLDQLEYNFFLWYDTMSRHPEGIFGTFQRFATFKLGLSTSSQVSGYSVFSDGTRIWDEERKFSGTLSRPIPGAFMTITPSLIGEWARTWRGGDYGQKVFSPDERLGAEFTLDTRRRYAYSLTQEAGTLLDLNGRRFFSGPYGAWKGLINVQELIALGPVRHSNLSLNAYYVVAPHPIDDKIPESIVKVGGSGTLSDLDPPLRGYPLGNFETRRAGIVQAEYRVPMAQLFQGFGTFPLFLNNVGVYGFYDGARLEATRGNYNGILGGTGGGFLLNTEIGYAIPIQLRLEIAHGLRRDLNGQDVVSLSAQL